MRILFEDQPYSPELMEAWGLGPYLFTSRDGNAATLPYVGYVYSSTLNDSIFILPKVFLFEGSGSVSKDEIAFGKYTITQVMEISQGHNPLKEDKLDHVLFGLSTWIYRAIDKYFTRHPKSKIIRRSFIQSVTSHRGESDQTLLDTIISLIDYHRDCRLIPST